MSQLLSAKYKQKRWPGATLPGRTLSNCKTNYMRLYLCAGILITCTTLLSCHKSNPNPTPANYEPLSLPANGTAVIDASNDFAIRMFRATLSIDAVDNNKLVSPLSIYTALSMVYNGAAGSTRDSMTHTLALNGIDIGMLNAVNKAMMEGLSHEDSKVQLSVANSIWYNTIQPKPLPSFLDSVNKNYHATIQGLNFGDPASAKTINSWVSQQTNNKITKIIDATSADDLMWLINAVYFNGAWKFVFKTSDTRNDLFHLSGGTTTSVAFMNQTATVPSYAAPGFNMIELPYGSGNAFCMDLLLPKDATRSIRDFALTLDRPALSKAVTGLDSNSFNIFLPKWEYRYNIDNMRPHLGMLGMDIAFGDAADFSNMYPGAVISQAIHKTYIKVSEEGTEAAAVTAISFTITSALPGPGTIKFDHPFVYLIREKQTGAILFMGIVADPSKN